MALPTSQPDWFSRPGDSLVAAMRRRGLTAGEVAEQLDGGLEQLRSFVVGSRPIDPAAAAVLAGTVGGSSEFWLQRQANYERDLDRAAGAISPGEANVWLTAIPAPGLKPRGKLSEEAKREELRRRLAFFGVSTLGAWEQRYGREREKTQFRTTTAFASDDGAVSLWLRQGELEASLADTAVWDPKALEAQLSGIKRLSRIAKPERFLPKLKELLATAGVALVAMRAPKECKASGASRLIRPDKAMVLVSFRYRSDDQFWFTVFHELGHLLLHGAAAFVDEDDMPEDQCEREANEFATTLIVPKNRRSEFDKLDANYENIARFAVSVGVGPGLVLGQLQHDGRLARDRFSFLRRRWSWNEIDAALTSL